MEGESQSTIQEDGDEENDEDMSGMIKVTAVGCRYL